MSTRVSTVDVTTSLVWLAGWDSGRALGDAEGHRRGHVEGYRLGEADGRAAALAEIEAARDAADDLLVRAIADWTARSVPYAVLADRRGEHDRAERQRQTLRDRGIAS